MCRSVNRVSLSRDYSARSAAVLEHLLPALRVALLWMQSRPEMWLLPALMPSIMQGGVPVAPFWGALSTLANAAKAVVEGAWT